MDITLTIFCVIAATFALSSLIFCRSLHSNDELSLPPGPKPWMWIGNLLDVLGLNFSPTDTCVKLSRKYGDMTTLWLGSSPIILINSPKVAHELLQKHAHETSSRPLHGNFRSKVFPSRIIVTPAGNELRRLQRIYHRILNSEKLIEFFNFQEQESRNFLFSLLDSPEKFQFECDRFAINVMLRAIYGVRLGNGEDNIVERAYKIWYIMYLFFLPGTVPCDIFPALLNLPSFLQPWQWLVKIMKRKEADLHAPYLGKYFHNASTFPEQGEEFGAQLALNSAVDGTNREAVSDILEMLLGAGSDTTSVALQNILKVIALHPEAAVAAQAELDAVVGSKRLPTWKDRSKLPYMNSLLKEVQRWAPIANIGTPHAANNNIDFNGYSIPKGTILLPNFLALNRDPAKYNNPDVFDPLRFLGEEKDAASLARNANYLVRDHYHFGFGRRFCPGSHIAEGAMYIFTARVLWAFHVKPKRGISLNLNEQRGALKDLACTVSSKLLTYPFSRRIEKTAVFPDLLYISRSYVQEYPRSDAGGRVR